MGATEEKPHNHEEKHNDNSNLPKILPALDTKDVKDESSHIHNPDTMEGQVQKIPYPKSVGFIISNEFCERFNYYGMRTILVLYLNRELGYSKDSSTVIFHIFTMFVYFLCILGAILADSFLGKFKTILYLSMVYVMGSIMVTLGAIPTWHLPPIWFTMIGLALIALGSGGIKPCVSAFGGDQFKMPEQVKQAATFFSLYYFSINSGSLISTTLTPILREDVRCFGKQECYSLAFGVPAILMVLSIIIFVLGRPLYKIRPPAGNVVVLVCKTIGNGMSTYFKERKSNPKEHWLDHAEKKYDKQLIADVKVLLRVLLLYVPLPIFWALFDQQGSRWTFQATRMNGDMGGFTIKPDQMQMLNPLLILIFIPLYDVAFYPLLNLVGIRRPLQKLTAGGILAGIAFTISGLVELKLETTYPVLPQAGEFQLRIFNGIPNCDYTFETNLTNYREFTVKSMELFEDKHIQAQPIDFSGYTKTSAACPDFPIGVMNLKDKTAHSFFINSKGMLHYEDNVDKPDRGNPVVRTLASVNGIRTVKWIEEKKRYLAYENTTDFYPLFEFKLTEYSVTVDNKEVLKTTLKQGGVYTLVIGEESEGVYKTQLFEVAEPNSLNILLLIPQYVVMTLGEVMFSVTGIEFSYSQAPVSMKSVLQACWLLTVAVGNVIVVIIAELKIFESQAYEFFLFAGLMFLDMIAFIFLAIAYKPNDPNAVSLISEADTEDTKPSSLELNQYKSD
ncbi:peptide transporter family 1 isoform X2 [Episyrphus balteatus]|uniref:peptide transporter family 1 isoform X2 n=1 Tax=Episyrphus balteatus TaxID=286459 RepID=UPI002485BA15|nr:peptide transporter family 1 isoform X2 [Episyrphus balteatus]